MKDLVFIAIPRNASGSIRTALESKPNFYTFLFQEELERNREPNLHISSNHSNWMHTKSCLLKAGKVWEDCVKFTVIRNPWSRVVSMFYHDAANFANLSFPDFLRSLPSIVQGNVRLAKDRRTIIIPKFGNKVKDSIPHKMIAESSWHPDRARFQYHVLPQFCHFYQEDSGSILDCILKYENVDLELNSFLEKNEHEPVVLEKINYSAKNEERRGRSTNKHYSEYYTEPWMIQLVEALYKVDVKLGNYTFI
jgi:hypothetical protein